MLISDQKSIRQIQEEFSEKFPFLKLEFYSSAHDPNEGSSDQAQLDSELTIGEVRNIHFEGDYAIAGSSSVAELETTFSDKFGLNVQVFRKSGDIWLQTITTDSWTLDEQNERGSR